MNKNSLYLQALTDDYLLCCATEGKSPKTIEWYSFNLKRFNRFLEEKGFSQCINDIGINEARRFIRNLQDIGIKWQGLPGEQSGKLSPFSVQGYARSIKAFWSWLKTEDMIQNNPMCSLKVPKAPHKLVNTFSSEQIRLILSSFIKTQPKEYRNYVMVLVLVDTGIRLSELATIELASVDFESSLFMVHGKGNKERSIPFGREVKRALWRYITCYRPAPSHPEVTKLFLSQQGAPLKPRAIQSMIRRIGKDLGICSVRCSPHTFRHTFAKQYLLNGGDVFSLQRILGHTSLEVVKLYVNLASDDIAAQHSRFSPADNMKYSLKKSIDIKKTKASKIGKPSFGSHHNYQAAGHRIQL
ncbi:MAG: tyrosine-type recombinase/integrase [Deltaproteobacteria bacterium]|nr:tyrosine-type recombinase/integrase [Deltaproteobacteria bacterium]